MIGALVAVAVVVVLRRPRWRLGLGAAATLLVLSVGVSIMIAQGVDPAKANGGWPSGFGFADGLAWAGVLFLGADAVVELMVRLRRQGDELPDRAGDAEDGAGPEPASAGGRDGAAG